MAVENNIEHLIADYNLDPEILVIRDYYDRDNIWRTLGIERDENSHSRFLAWVLQQNVQEKQSPLYRFIGLLHKKSQSKEQFSDALWKAFLYDEFRIKSAEISTEKLVSNVSKIRYIDRIDIYADCLIEGVENYNHLEIVIENKVESKEGKNKPKNVLNNPTEEENEYKTKGQTERYYYACTELRKEQDKQLLQLFVFLSPSGGNAQEEHFINISYQELVDYVLEPYSKSSQTDDYTKSALQEYFRNLCNPNNKYSSIIATMAEEKELLKNFLNKNKDLFQKAIAVVLSDSDALDSDEKEKLKELSDKVKALKTKSRFYKISSSSYIIPNGKDRYRMYEVVNEFIKYRMNAGDSYNDIVTFIDKCKLKKIIARNPNDVNTGSNKTSYFEGTDEKRNKFYVTKEWVGASKGENGSKHDGNFVLLYKAINKEYKDFQIEEII